MVKPRDQDVVFLEDTTVERAAVDLSPAALFASPTKPKQFRDQSQDHSLLDSFSSSSETLGNSVYKKLLLEYYDEYSTCQSELQQQSIRKIVLQRFENEMAALQRSKPLVAFSLHTTTVNATSLGPSKPQFLVHRKQGNSFCFTKVFFKHNMDRKIKESFEYLRRVEHRIDPEDRGPVGITSIHAPASTTIWYATTPKGKANPIEQSETPKTEATTPVSQRGGDPSSPGDDNGQNSTLSNKDENENANENENKNEDENENGNENGNGNESSKRSSSNHSKPPSSKRSSSSDSTSTSHDSTTTSSAEESETSSSTTFSPSSASTNKDPLEQAAGCASGELETMDAPVLEQNVKHTFATSNLGKLGEKLFRSRKPQSTVHEPSIVGKQSDNIRSISGMLPMDEILVSPYDGNRSAETGEEPLERWKNLLPPNDDSTMNPFLSQLYGEPLAKSIFRAKAEIATSKSLFEISWNWGEINSLQLGWIPKRQLLLCLCEDKISNPAGQKLTAPNEKEQGNGDSSDHGDASNESNNESTSDNGMEDDDEEDVDEETKALKAVTRKLECFEITMSAMRAWKVKLDFPELYSNKDGGEFLFQPETTNETKQNCYKCLVFVARVFATLLLFQEEKSVSPSLFRKVRACLQILNTHAKAHPSDLAKILKKKRKRELDSLRKHQQQEKKRRLGGNYDDREATLRGSFALVQQESETLLKMMDYYKTRLMLRNKHSGARRDDDTEDDTEDDNDEDGSSCQPMDVSFLETMTEEIAANARRDFEREERFRKKLLKARQTKLDS